MQKLKKQRQQLVNQKNERKVEYISLNIYPKDYIDRKPTNTEIKEIFAKIALNGWMYLEA